MLTYLGLGHCKQTNQEHLPRPRARHLLSRLREKRPPHCFWERRQVCPLVGYRDRPTDHAAQHRGWCHNCCYFARRAICSCRISGPKRTRLGLDHGLSRAATRRSRWTQRQCILGCLFANRSRVGQRKFGQDHQDVGVGSAEKHSSFDYAEWWKMYQDVRRPQGS